MRIVCDTNVLVRAAIHPSGQASELMRRIRASHVLISSLPILAEVFEVLRRPKIRLLHGRDDKEIRRFVVALYRASAIVRLPFPVPRVVPHDPKDDAVLLTAMGGQADVLATRDHHLFHPDVLAIAAKHGVRIVSDDVLLGEL